MSSTRRDRAKFDHWSELIIRRVKARQLTAVWSRYVVTRDGVARPLSHPMLVPEGGRVFWVGEVPPQRLPNGITWTPPPVGISEEEFVHPSWAHPGPAPRTRRQRKAGR